jgi:C4-dicarboxylate-specific signal transduction histidine kinase
MKHFKARFNSLPVQMILSFMGLVLLMAAAAGAPAIWLLNRQLEQQAWAQVEQGNRATRALYTATQKEIENLATLTAQRPTLHRLLAQGERSALISYLQTLKNGAGLDLIRVCDESG